MNEKDSIHSRARLQQNYPNLNLSMIQTFYGLNVGALDQVIYIRISRNSQKISRIYFKNMWDYRTALPDTFALARSQTEAGTHKFKLNYLIKIS